MIIIYIHLIVSIITILMMILSSIVITDKFKVKYPGLEVPKQSFAEKALIWTRDILAALIPIFNIIICMILVFDYKSFETRTINNMYLQCLDEKYKEEREKC